MSNLPDEFKITELRPLPEGWVWVKLREICDLVNGRAFKQSEWSSKGLPIIRIQNLNNVDADFNCCDFEVENKYLVDDNQLLFAWSGTPGTSFGAHIWKRGKAVLNQHIFKVEINEDNINKIFFMYLLNNNVSEYVRKAHGTAGLAHITKNKFENSLIPLPPLAEQHRIVEKLEALLTQVDTSKDHLARVPPLIKRFRQSVLASACSGRLTEDWRRENTDVEPVIVAIENIKIRRLAEATTSSQKKKINEMYMVKESKNSDKLPENWKYVNLEKLSESLQYGTSKKSTPTGKVPVLRMGNLQESRISWDDLVYTSDDGDIKKYNLEPNTVLFNRTNSPELVGKTAIYRGERPAIFAGYLIRVKNYKELDSEYLNYCLNTIYAQEYYARVKTDGVSQSNINAQKLGKFEVPFCPLPEQHAIVRRVEELFHFASDVEERVANATAHTDRLTQSILAKAFRGELVPQDPNDESATVLLERIKKERSEIEKKKKAKKMKKNGKRKIENTVRI